MNTADLTMTELAARNARAPHIDSTLTWTDSESGAVWEIDYRDDAMYGDRAHWRLIAARCVSPPLKLLQWALDDACAKADFYGDDR